MTRESPPSSVSLRWKGSGAGWGMPGGKEAEGGGGGGRVFLAKLDL